MLRVINVTVIFPEPFHYIYSGCRHVVDVKKAVGQVFFFSDSRIGKQTELAWEINRLSTVMQALNWIPDAVSQESKGSFALRRLACFFDYKTDVRSCVLLLCLSSLSLCAAVLCGHSLNGATSLFELQRPPEGQHTPIPVPTLCCLFCPHFCVNATDCVCTCVCERVSLLLVCVLCGSLVVMAARGQKTLLEEIQAHFSGPILTLSLFAFYSLSFAQSVWLLNRNISGTGVMPR